MGTESAHGGGHRTHMARVVCAETSGEKVPEVFEGKVDMTFDRTDGNVEGLGYFLG